VIAIAGFFSAIFSLFDPGLDYGPLEMGTLSITCIFMTQVPLGMGKTTFTVVTGDPWIHFITLHVLMRPHSFLYPDVRRNFGG